MFKSPQSALLIFATTVLVGALLAPGLAWTYPPTITPGEKPQIFGDASGGGPIFSGSHNYGNVIIDVLVTGDINQFLWEYTVTNLTYDPNPGTSNGFSGFELALPGPVPGFGNVTAPSGIPPWMVNCCSGLPVEWDISNTAGSGVMPGNSGVFSFTSDPVLITVSTGWFHTWETDIQTNVINYPPGDEPECPDVFAVDVELCCYEDATGEDVCEPVLVGQCAALGGSVVQDCAECLRVPVEESTWGRIKTEF